MAAIMARLGERAAPPPAADGDLAAAASGSTEAGGRRLCRRYCQCSQCTQRIEASRHERNACAAASAAGTPRVDAGLLLHAGYHSKNSTGSAAWTRRAAELQARRCPWQAIYSSGQCRRLFMLFLTTLPLNADANDFVPLPGANDQAVGSAAAGAGLAAGGGIGAGGFTAAAGRAAPSASQTPECAQLPTPTIKTMLGAAARSPSWCWSTSDGSGGG